MKFKHVNYLISNFILRQVGKMSDWEELELTSCHRHSNITIYRANIEEKDLKTSRKDLLQLNI